MAAPDLQRILDLFRPARHTVAYCFAYGSGVFRQSGRAERPAAMVDLMFVVRDSVGFHRANLAANPGHYSALRRLGPAAVARVQRSRFGARVYFNTRVADGGGGPLFKYGVIDADDFRRDLRTWSDLYVAGRLHKPVRTLADADGLAGGPAVARNLESAVHASLLQLPGAFAERDLYAAIAGLSYGGDFRMVVGEDRNKVANIVRPQVERFRALYRPALESMADRVRFRGGAVEQDATADGRLYHLRRLPAALKTAVLGSAAAGVDGDPLRSVAGRADVATVVRDAVRRIVFRSSLAQSVKGIPTAGLLKSVLYSCDKLSKMVKSM